MHAGVTRDTNTYRSGFVLTGGSFLPYGLESSLGLEELPVTFRVLGFASDGWVMATDRCQLSSHSAVNDSTKAHVSIRTTECTGKIIWDRANGIACCASGDDIALMMATKIVNRATLENNFNDNTAERIREIARNTYFEAHCIEAFRSDERNVLAVVPTGVWHVKGRGDAYCVTQINKAGTIYIGDTANPAVFILQRYYPTFPRDANGQHGVCEWRTVDELRCLLAHTVLEAHFCNQSSVNGLNVLTYRNEQGFCLLGEKELAELTSKSNAVAKEYEHALFR